MLLLSYCTPPSICEQHQVSLPNIAEKKFQDYSQTDKNDHNTHSQFVEGLKECRSLHNIRLYLSAFELKFSVLKVDSEFQM